MSPIVSDAVALWDNESQLWSNSNNSQDYDRLYMLYRKYSYVLWTVLDIGNLDCHPYSYIPLDGNKFNSNYKYNIR